VLDPHSSYYRYTFGFLRHSWKFFVVFQLNGNAMNSRMIVVGTSAASTIYGADYCFRRKDTKRQNVSFVLFTNIQSSFAFHVLFTYFLLFEH